MYVAGAKSLPVFARPARILVFRQFPLLPTGKVDRITLQVHVREAETDRRRDDAQAFQFL
jgi:hypothetical protein